MMQFLAASCRALLVLSMLVPGSAEATQRLTSLQDGSNPLNMVEISEECPKQYTPEVARLVFAQTDNFLEVTERNGRKFLHGAEAIETVRALARTSFESICVRQVEFADLLNELKANRADYASGMITQTADRGREVYFTVPIYHNQQALITKGSQRVVNTLRVFGFQLGVALIVLVISGLFIYAVARRQVRKQCERDDTVSNPILYSLEIALHTTTTIGFGNRYISGWIGLVAIFMMFNAASFLSSFISSRLVNYNLAESPLSSPTELAGQKIAAQRNTVHEQEVLKYGAKLVTIANEAAGVAMLQKGTVSALITDSVIAQGLTNHHQDLVMALVWGRRDIGPAARTPELAAELTRALMVNWAADGEGL